jgi:GTPase
LRISYLVSPISKILEIFSQTVSISLKLGYNDFMFVDEAEIVLIAGHGGPGRVSFHKPPVKGPDGGNGGKGADIYLQSSDSVSSLEYFTKRTKIEAPNGAMGGANRMSGKNATDVTISIPTYSEVTDIDTGEVFDFPQPGITMLLVKGGKGGRGNFEFRSSRNTTPEYAQPGLKGQERRLKLHIKLIAKTGLIGLPNSGKSSLLNELTNAQAKVGSYPFTTLEPNLGVFENKQSLRSGDLKIIADIPGIIEGASEGKGLGIKFLKHIEKVETLLHCISCESENPLADYKTVRKELDNFNPGLRDKKEIILLTKSDLVYEKDLKETQKKLKKLGKPILAVSIYNFDSMEELKKLI